jgi:hypothetical protein
MMSKRMLACSLLQAREQAALRHFGFALPQRDLNPMISRHV